jgi:anaerobic selenocysteine-containing dehydrogenase
MTRVCSLCEAMCGLVIEKDGERVSSIRGHAGDVFSRGAFCPKSQGLLDIYEDPDRLHRPLKRTSQGFEAISWKQAFEEISSKINELQKSHGREVLATYLGNPNVHNTGNLLMLPIFLKGLRTPNKFSATSVDQLPHQLVSYLMFGHQLLIPIADVDRTDYMLILGANPAVSNGSLLSAAGLSSRLKHIQKRGGKVVVIDPRYTETASLATEHHFIRPAADAYFLASFVRLLLDSKCDRSGLEAYLDGVPEVYRLFADWPVERVEEFTGIPLAVVQRLVQEFTQAPRAVCYGRMGLSTQEFGTVCQWLINLINILSGNFDREGGALFTKPAFDVVDIMARMGGRGSFGRRKSRVRGLPEFNGEFPSSTLADEILTPGQGQVKALITIAGNPVLSLPGGAKLEKAMETLDLYVAIDFYQNESTRLAHYILPPTTALEHGHFDVIFNAFAIRNIVRWSEPVFAKPQDALEDWEILLELWSRIGPHRGWLEQRKRQAFKLLVQRLGLERLIDIGLRLGPYRQKGVSLKTLKAKPDGLDLGPLEPSLPQRLYTKDKKIRLVPERLLPAWALLKATLAQAPAQRGVDEFQLIGRRHLRSNNSWMHNRGGVGQKARHPCHALMHPDDAVPLGIASDQIIRLDSPMGHIELPVLLSDRIMSGVISVPHGWGHHRTGTRLSRASIKPGVSVNDITDDSRIDGFSGNAAFSGQWVKVKLSHQGQEGGDTVGKSLSGDRRGELAFF